MKDKNITKKYLLKIGEFTNLYAVVLIILDFLDYRCMRFLKLQIYMEKVF